MKKIYRYLKGKKTYIVAVAAIIYGVYVGNIEAILLGLGFLGLRNGLTTEMTKRVIKKK